MTGGQNCLLLAMDMAKEGGPVSVVNVLHNFEHPKSTPYYFSLQLFLSVTHIMRACLFAPTFNTFAYPLVNVYIAMENHNF